MHGKMPENPDFKCWNITPTGAFNYAYTDDGQSVQYVAVSQQHTTGTIPFDLNYTPVKMRIPVKQIDWSLVDDRYTPAQPEQGHLTLLNNVTQYIDLVPYGCTELRLTVFPDANAKPLPAPEEPDYTRPADAPSCVQVVDGHYCAYFELPRFCWDEPIYCKVRYADGTADLHSNQDGDLCEQVGTTALGRHIWRWTGPAVSQSAPVELIFTNHDLLTGIMAFANGGYYNYDRLLYKAGEDTQTGIRLAESADNADAWFSDQRSECGVAFTLDGRLFEGRPTKKGLYIYNRKKIVVK